VCTFLKNGGCINNSIVVRRTHLNVKFLDLRHFMEKEKFKVVNEDIPVNFLFVSWFH
jgi:hypothetical protein